MVDPIVNVEDLMVNAENLRLIITAEKHVKRLLLKNLDASGRLKMHNFFLQLLQLINTTHSNFNLSLNRAASNKVCGEYKNAQSEN